MKVTMGRFIAAMAAVATFGVGAMVGRFATRSVEAAAAAVVRPAPFPSDDALVAANREAAAPAGKIEGAAPDRAEIFEAAYVAPLQPQGGKPPAPHDFEPAGKPDGGDWEDWAEPAGDETAPDYG
jgi:hypothetical protein